MFTVRKKNYGTNLFIVNKINIEVGNQEIGGNILGYWRVGRAVGKDSSIIYVLLYYYIYSSDSANDWVQVLLEGLQKIKTIQWYNIYWLPYEWCKYYYYYHCY